jgi:transcriptional regulator with XRE-family HTH domain
MNLGFRIQSERQKHGLTLRDLAAQTGLSPSFLSQVERDVTAPSLASLKQIATALGVRVADLLAEASPGEGIVVRRAGRPTWQLDRVRYAQLAPGKPGQERSMQPQLLTFEPGGDLGSHPVSHAGEELGLVLKGRVECSVGDEVYLLEEGDSVYFDAKVPHRTRNAAPTESTYLLVVTPPSF